MINSLSEQFPLKTIGIVLTDDYYTYLGIASLFEDGKCFMFPLNGEYNSCQISASEDIIIIIDGRVFIQGVWKGFKALMQHYPHARRIWLTRRDIGKLYPHGCDRDPDIDPDLAKPVFIEHFIKYACANEVAVGELAPLTKKEEELLWHFLYKKSMSQIASSYGMSRKTLYIHRLRICRKYGFKRFFHLLFIYQRSRHIFASKICRVDKNADQA
ncbi:helix-turn-helix transcriptional regulator [Salmonella enterica subsp. enterica serovar Ituri]|nr:helix-turn-helix transcriptional regulator [Salmonella enterica subsp. enterica serovar Ituri]EBV2943749.1 helix-turn-helix transcriptional regulator [Salmonella enterica subsp. enterica serovar Woodhull]EJU7225192.1 helix-turn-helix transcriptional regulator [Salmonella enterica]EBU7752862.1 helix-turn-helix transcriptional regulator [Salmonella enterica subsp. enterica serovar Ituri]EBV2915108.1 helix-turn-helix transcriptional regulator [Salmonella enterica subsp. enterica serovar Ituri]